MTNLTDFLNSNMNLIYLSISILLIIFLYVIVERNLLRFAKRNKNVYLDDLSTGIKLFTRLIAGYLIIICIGLYYNLGSISLLLIGLVATIISLSSIQILNNFLAGLVIIVLKPFEINDYINIGGFEGRVIKIALNYTKLITINNAYVLLPNRTILHSDLINYTIHKKVKKDENSYLADAQNLLNPFLGNKITKYTFMISFDVATLSVVLPKMENVCKDYTQVFGYEPAFFLYRLGWKIGYQFQIRSDDSETIRSNLKEFRNKLLKMAYP